MNLTEFSLRRPVTTFMIFLSVAVIGVISVKLLPMEFFPSIDVPFIVVEVPYPGSNPEEIEKQAESSALRCPDGSATKRMKELINQAKKQKHLFYPV